MAIKIIAIGRRHEAWLEAGIERYERRLTVPFKCEWVLLSPSPQKGMRAAQEESERIEHKLHKDAFIVVLDERGQQFTSPALSHLLTEPLERSQEIVIVIGGAYGVTQQLRDTASVVWSLSPLVFPHQLVRLILIEQLYRSQMIRNEQSYHNH